MAWLEEYKTALWAISCLVGAAVAWGVLYAGAQNTNALAIETARTVGIDGNRITALEQNYKHINDQLDGISQDLRGINQKLDRK